MEEDVEGDVEIAHVHRSRKFRLRSAAGEEEDSGVVRQVLLAGVEERLPLGDGAVCEREVDVMGQHGLVSLTRRMRGSDHAVACGRVARIDSALTGRITPRSVMMPVISSAGVTSEA